MPRDVSKRQVPSEPQTSSEYLYSVPRTRPKANGTLLSRTEDQPCFPTLHLAACDMLCFQLAPSAACLIGLSHLQMRGHVSPGCVLRGQPLG